MSIWYFNNKVSGRARNTKTERHGHGTMRVKLTYERITGTEVILVTDQCVRQ